MRFFAVPDCGCGGSSSSSGSSSQTTLPKCHDNLLSLQKVAKVQVVGVIPNSNCLGQFTSIRGFLFNDGTGNGQHIENEPDLPLPIINEPDEGDPVEVPEDGWPFLLIATGAGNTTPWNFVQAPATGEFTLQTEDGLFKLKPAGQLPGFNAIYNAVETADMVFLLGGVPIEDEEGQFETKKLKALDKRVVVGVENEDESVGFRSLPDATPLEHPTVKPDLINPKTFQQRDDAGNDVVGGLPVYPVSGVGAPGDGVLCMYSPTQKRFYRAPATIKKSCHSNTFVTVPDNGEWQTIGSGHCSISGLTANYPALMVIATIRTTMIDEGGDPIASGADFTTMDFALFVNGNLTFIFDPKGSPNNTLHWLIEDLTPGTSLNVEIKVMKENVAGQNLRVSESHMNIFSVE